MRDYVNELRDFGESKLYEISDTKSSGNLFPMDDGLQNERNDFSRNEQDAKVNVKENVGHS